MAQVSQGHESKNLLRVPDLANVPRIICVNYHGGEHHDTKKEKGHDQVFDQVEVRDDSGSIVFER